MPQYGWETNDSTASVSRWRYVRGTTRTLSLFTWITPPLGFFPQACAHRWKNVYYRSEHILPHGFCSVIPPTLQGKTQTLIPCYEGIYYGLFFFFLHTWFTPVWFPYCTFPKGLLRHLCFFGVRALPKPFGSIFLWSFNERIQWMLNFLSNGCKRKETFSPWPDPKRWTRTRSFFVVAGDDPSITSSLVVISQMLLHYFPSMSFLSLQSGSPWFLNFRFWDAAPEKSGKACTGFFIITITFFFFFFPQAEISCCLAAGSLEQPLSSFRFSSQLQHWPGQSVFTLGTGVCVCTAYFAVIQD